MNDFILEAKGVRKYFPIKKGFFMREVGQVKAIEEVNLSIRRGETLGLVGESGCGKSTLGRTLIRLYEPTAGTVQFDGENFLNLSGEALRKKRRDIQMIFQDPYASLDTRMTVGQIIEQPFKIHGLLGKIEREIRVKQLLEMVGLKASHVNRYPHEFSGGQRQRISIARAISLNPKLIICDEPVSALDVSIQAQILNLLKDLQDRLQLTYLFISHDLSVIEHVCDRIAVMYLGRIVEITTREELYKNPRHPYTRALMSSIPSIGTGKKKMHKILSGEIPSPINPPSGCAFHPRCSYRIKECSEIVPRLLPVSPEHFKACHVNLDTNLKEITL